MMIISSFAHVINAQSVSQSDNDQTYSGSDFDWWLKKLAFTGNRIIPYNGGRSRYLSVNHS